MRRSTPKSNFDIHLDVLNAVTKELNKIYPTHKFTFKVNTIVDEGSFHYTEAHYLEIFSTDLTIKDKPNNAFLSRIFLIFTPIKQSKVLSYIFPCHWNFEWNENFPKAKELFEYQWSDIVICGYCNTTNPEENDNCSSCSANLWPETE